MERMRKRGKLILFHVFFIFSTPWLRPLPGGGREGKGRNEKVESGNWKVSKWERKGKEGAASSYVGNNCVFSHLLQYFKLIFLDCHSYVTYRMCRYELYAILPRELD